MRPRDAAVPRPRHIGLVLAVVGVLFTVNSALAANAVIMESKWVASGEQNVEVGVYIANEDSLGAIVLPLEFRAIHVGAFITRALTIHAASRMAFIESPDNSDNIIQKLYFPHKKRTYWTGYGAECRPDSMGRIWLWDASDSLPDFVGEEAMMFAAVPIGLIPPGDDITGGQGNPSLVLRFDVTAIGGAFVIDTCCVRPANHLLFVSDRDDGSGFEPVVPQFHSSIVLVGCDSECHGDPNCDGLCNMIDLVKSIDVAFNGAPPVVDPDPRCPIENTDVNCDLMTNVQDIVKMINVQYRHVAADVEFCAPCDHIPRTGNPKEDVRTPYFRNNGS